MIFRPPWTPMPEPCGCTRAVEGGWTLQACDEHGPVTDPCGCIRDYWTGSPDTLCQPHLDEAEREAHADYVRSLELAAGWDPTP